MGIRPTLVILLAVLLVGCQQGHCRRQIDAPAEAQPLPPAAAEKPSEQDRIFVYKFDGSLQCKQGKVIAVEAMAKELEGIPVLSSNKKSDGQMHIQACGSITGR